MTDNRKRRAQKGQTNLTMTSAPTAIPTEQLL